MKRGASHIVQTVQRISTHISAYCQYAGYRSIAGIDEAGRGPLAGPVVAAAVILPFDYYNPLINDSKQLSKKNREVLYTDILSHAITYGIGCVSNKQIDRINIYQATLKAMKKALHQCSPQPDFILIDAMPLQSTYPTVSLIKGDQRDMSIAAASIIAKVTRDRIMYTYHKKYPYYGFITNMGYPTAQHIKALQEYGSTPIHRMTFAHVKSLA